MKKLQAELDEAIPDPRVIPDFAALQKLPYLNAFIKEGKYYLIILLPAIISKPYLQLSEFTPLLPACWSELCLPILRMVP